MKLTAIQLAILGALFSPESPYAWRSLQHREYRLQWHRDNPERSRKIKLRWSNKNSDSLRKSARQWKSRNGDKVRAQYRTWKTAEWKNNPAFRLTEGMRSRVRLALKNCWKSGNSLELLGCAVPQLRAHLEALFAPGMTWENYGQWHVDHKRPCASFDLTDPAQQRICFHYTNLQPLWALDNIKKGAKYSPAI